MFEFYSVKWPFEVSSNTMVSLWPISFMRPYKKRTVIIACSSIDTFVTSWLKWFKMNSNDQILIFRHIETHLESFQIFCRHLNHESTKLASCILRHCLPLFNFIKKALKGNKNTYSLLIKVIDATWHHQFLTIKITASWELCSRS